MRLRERRSNGGLRERLWQLDGMTQDDWTPILLVRTLLPLVQRPPAGAWADRGRAPFVVHDGGIPRPRTPPPTSAPLPRAASRCPRAASAPGETHARICGPGARRVEVRSPAGPGGAASASTCSASCARWGRATDRVAAGPAQEVDLPQHERAEIANLRLRRHEPRIEELACLGRRPHERAVRGRVALLDGVDLHEAELLERAQRAAGQRSPASSSRWTRMTASYRSSRRSSEWLPSRPGHRGGETSMPDRILTSHAGSLPRPEELVALNLLRGQGELDDEAGYQAKLTQAVVDVVAHQRELGHRPRQRRRVRPLDGAPLRLRPWWTYVFQRLGGLELVTDGVLDIQQAPGKPGELSLASFAERRDWLEFSDAYGDPNSGAALPNPDIGTGAPVCRGPITYTGREALDRDIANLKAALDAAGLQEGYMNSVAPGSCARFGNEYYEDDQDAHVRVRGRAARGVRGDHRRRAGPAARRSRDRRELGPDQPRAVRRGLPALHHAARRRAQPRHPRPARGPHPLPPVLGQLARART